MAVRFDASGDNYTRTATVPSVTTFSVTCWGYTSVDRNASGVHFSFDNAGVTQFVVLGTASDGTRLTINATSGSGALLDDPGTGAWYFIAMTKSGTSLVGYSAVLSAATLTSASMTIPGSTASLNKLWIATDGFNDWLNGRVAAVKIWDGVALTAAEIAQERWCYLPQRTANLFDFLPMLDTTMGGSDLSGGGRDFTAAGTLATEDGPPISWSGFLPSVYVPAVAASAVRSRRTLDPRAGARGVPWI